MFSCEFCEIFRNIFSTKHLPTAASVMRKQLMEKELHLFVFYDPFDSSAYVFKKPSLYNFNVRKTSGLSQL